MRKKVLIIEDSTDIGSALKTLIEYEGYEALLANSAATGWELAKSTRADLMIIDVRLPDEDGLELTRRLRSNPETSLTPIVCVSSYIWGLEAEALLAGCNEVFSKVTFMESYRETLSKYLADSKALGTDAG
jgi:DNA-binding response OmpR family regulator